MDLLNLETLPKISLGRGESMWTCIRQVREKKCLGFSQESQNDTNHNVSVFSVRVV